MATFPTNPAVGAVHVLDATTFVYNGNNWEASWAATLPHLNKEVISNYLQPSGVSVGTIWSNPTNSEIRMFDGINWNLIGSTGA